ncbi:hypothetical protein VNO77_45139 [Canavalia gladiata]|uniref:Uncharacterized protein n=1 Tax=Canavalia gladiata TaxID=3824 RepID=A0AAN9JSA1_CANGL
MIPNIFGYRKKQRCIQDTKIPLFSIFQISNTNIVIVNVYAHKGLSHIKGLNGSNYNTRRSSHHNQSTSREAEKQRSREVGEVAEQQV